MFQNSYQNGTFFEVFDPKLPQEKAKNLYRQQNVQANNKVFDKQLKTFIFQYNSANSKISFPKEDKKQLYLIQQYLCLQIQFASSDWNIQLTVSDLTKTKRRIILSPSVHKNQKKPFFVKSVCPPVSHGVWINFCIDLYSFIEAFKGQTYRSLDLIQITGIFRLRRIFTTQHLIPELNQGIENQPVLLPKNLLFPPEINHENMFVQFLEQHNEELIDQVSTKSNSHIGGQKKSRKEIGSKKSIKQPKQIKTIKNIKQTNHQMDIKNGLKINQKQQEVSQEVSLKLISKQNYQLQAKQQNNEEKVKHKQNTYKNEKKFLANTNGLQNLSKNRKDVQKSDLIHGQESSKAITPLSTGKNLKKRRQTLTKTQIPKQKVTSVEKSNKKINENEGKNKDKIKPKANPWRSSIKNKNQTGRCQPDKVEQERKVESAQATLLKSRNGINDKLQQTKGRIFLKNSDCSRDQDYFQLSQKFSTVTEGRFFKNQMGSRNFHQEQPKHAHDEIQQNIEIEANSYYSNSNEKNKDKDKQNFCLELQQRPIEQSINDSLDQFNKIGSNRKEGNKMLSNNQSYFNMSSRFGFGSKMMDKFTNQINRPYSPPLGEREHQEEANDGKHVINQENEMELIYDPVLNCYYDHKTHTYYQLKN